MRATTSYGLTHARDLITRLMNEAVARYRQNKPQFVLSEGALSATTESAGLQRGLARTVNQVLRRRLRWMDQRFYIGLDYATDDAAALPQALLLARPGQHHHTVVPITWTTGTVTIGPAFDGGYKRTVIMGAPNAGQRLTDALILMTAVYFAPEVVRRARLAQVPEPLPANDQVPVVSAGRRRRF